jgi:Bacteriocin-protection, YdeI or OmpD-Associated
MNARWHELHPMPKNASLAQRVAWHTAHARYCACRPMPKSIVAALHAPPPVRAAVSRLQRDIQPMPADVKQKLKARGLTKAYDGRPPYQQNDYLGWLARAKLPTTRQKRLEQMLTELERGDVYMKMKWSPTASKSEAKRKPAPRQRPARSRA